MDICSVIDIVRESANLMVREGFSIEEKGTIENIVTSSDLAIQHYLMEKLSTILPGCGFLCEEEELSDTSHKQVWIIDPIDGTANYARGDENCCISVSLIEKGHSILGVVYSPWRNQLWCAERGKGAFCNGLPIGVSGRSFEQGLFYTAMSTYKKEFARTCSNIIYDIYINSNDIRRLGSAAVELCLLAEGKAELFFEMRLMPWDYAAASLIIQEAGGFICGFDGEKPSLSKPSLVLASNSKENLQRILSVVHKYMKDLPY